MNSTSSGASEVREFANAGADGEYCDQRCVAMSKRQTLLTSNGCEATSAAMSEVPARPVVRPPVGGVRKPPALGTSAMTCTSAGSVVM